MSGVRWPSIVEIDANTWGMVYNEDDPDWQLSYATSPKSDPHNWTKATGDNPILTAAGAGSIRGFSVLKDGGTYHVLYDTIGQICYASGSALTSLTKHSATDVPVFSGQGSGWEQYVRHPTSIIIGSTVHMFYDGRTSSATGTKGAIGHATSTDWISWTRDTTNPKLMYEGTGWESDDLSAPHIALLSGRYYLFYSGYNGGPDPFPHKIGYAVAENNSLIRFAKYSNNPIIDLGATSEWDEDLVDGAFLFQESGNVHLYFEGRASNVSAIGYATT